MRPHPHAILSPLIFTSLLGWGLNCSAQYPATDPNNTGNWVLNSYNSDEFNAGALDSKWHIMASPGNTATVGTDPVTGDHALILTVTYAGASSYSGWGDNTSTPSNASGVGVMLGSSFNTQDLSRGTWAGYGYYEARFKSNAASASSTFWLWGSDPSGWATEIDIEDGGAHYTNPPVAGTPTVADYATANAGVWAYPGRPAGQPNPGGAGTDTPGGSKFTRNLNLSSAYHIFGLQWDANYITWYIDGEQIAQIRNGTGNATSIVGPTPPGNAFNIPMQILMDSSIFPGWYGNPIASQMPATTYYDYVRVWTKSPNPPTPTPTATPRPTATPVPTATPRPTVTPTPVTYTLSVSSPAANATVNGTIQIVGQAPGFLNVEVSDSSGTLLGARHPTPRGPTPLRWIPPDLPTAPTR